MKLFRLLKFRFMLFFTLLIVLICVTLSYFAIQDTTVSVSKVFAQQGTTIAENAAAIIDGDAFERLVKTLDASDPFYEETRLELLDIKQKTNSLYLYTMAPTEGGIYRFIIDGSAPPDDEENFSALGDEEDVSEYHPAFAQCWAEKRTVFSELQDQGEWGWLLSVYAPIFNSAGTMVGLVGCDYDADEIKNELNIHRTRQIIITVFFIFAGLVLMLFFVRLIFGRLAIINDILTEISEGEGDLTRKIAISHDDEIGQMGKQFNKTLEKIKHLVVAIKARTSSLSDIGNDLSDHMNETTTDIKLITENILSIKGEVINQSASVVETHATMEQVSINIDKLNSNVEMQTVSVSDSSAAVEEMLANIQSVATTLVKNAENVNELAAASEVGRAGLEEVSRDIQEIEKESEGLLKINSVMENIASQTNLLSMNAAIEAAHAGEKGRGFAVVAAEIRKLAVSSGDQSKIISDVLKKMKAAIDKITKSTGTVLQEFEAINSRIKTVSNQEENIRNTMEEQGKKSQEILDAISRLNELTQQVKEGSDQMFEGSKEVIHESSNLGKMTQKVSSEINEIAAGADHINASVGKVNEISHANKQHIDALVSEVAKFKID